MKDLTSDVAIIGTGPVGLITATVLAKESQFQIIYSGLSQMKKL